MARSPTLVARPRIFVTRSPTTATRSPKGAHPAAVQALRARTLVTVAPAERATTPPLAHMAQAQAHGPRRTTTGPRTCMSRPGVFVFKRPRTRTTGSFDTAEGEKVPAGTRSVTMGALHLHLRPPGTVHETPGKTRVRKKSYGRYLRSGGIGIDRLEAVSARRPGMVPGGGSVHPFGRPLDDGQRLGTMAVAPRQSP